MVATVTGQVLALGLVALMALLLNRVSRLELTLSCVVCGIVAGQAIGFLDFDTGIRANNLEQIVFYIILPVLIFESSWQMKPKLLRRWLMPVLILATVGVLISCVVTAALVYLGVGHPEGFPWIAALLTGAILAATDPVSVIYQLNAEEAPENLKTLFEGESLFNDATAVVLFSLLMLVATTGVEVGAGQFFFEFGLVFIGGIVTGVVVGMVGAVVVLLLGQAAATPFVLLVCAFGSFYLADHVLHVSGIMAVMTAALVLRGSLHEVEDSVASTIGATWDWMGQAFTSVLFVIMGLVITFGMFQQMWLAMIIAIVAALIARACAVGASALICRPLINNISGAWQILLIWGGLRGAVAIALVMALPLELPYWYTVQSMVFGVVLFSLVVQGTTNSALIRRYGAEAEE
jgi:Na+:H+ antiporter